MKVSFIGIGAQKSATSWLHDVLSLNPEIETSEPKELDYFSSNFDRGELWYESHFTDPAAAARGECSPSYFFDLDAPDRAHNYNADLKLIAILRDPVDRAFSNHLHEIRKGHIGPAVTFEEALPRNHAYLEQGRYARHITRWSARFGRDALLVLLAEEIPGNPAAAYAAVCQHLGVKAHDLGSALHRRSHESIGRRNKLIARILRRGGDALRGAGLGAALQSVKASPTMGSLLALNNLDLRKAVPAMQPQTRSDLERIFKDDVEFVADFLRRDMLPWTSWKDMSRKGAAVAAEKEVSHG